MDYSKMFNARSGGVLYFNGCKIPVRVMERTLDSRNYTEEFKVQTCNYLEVPDIYGPGIKKVIFNDPATIVIWEDGVKTVVKCQPEDTYDPEKGLAMAIAKRYFGNTGNYNKVFQRHIPEEDPVPIALANPLTSISEAIEEIRRFSNQASLKLPNFSGVTLGFREHLR